MRISENRLSESLLAKLSVPRQIFKPRSVSASSGKRFWCRKRWLFGQWTMCRFRHSVLAQEFKIAIVQLIEMCHDTVLADQSVFNQVSQGRSRSAIGHRSAELLEEIVKFSREPSANMAYSSLDSATCVVISRFSEREHSSATSYILADAV